MQGNRCEIRTETSDAAVVYDTFISQYHRPLGLLRDPRLIVDLGANIGTTAADFAVRYPNAHIVAVEPEPKTAELCRRNVAPWADRITVIEAAVWKETGIVSFAVPDGQHWAGAIGNGESTLAVQAITLDDILDGRDVDYLKIDIEGAEREVIKSAGGWIRRVNMMHIEIHGAYTVEECIADLASHGFAASSDPRREHSVVATRR